jgi:peptide/nickel transport system ATP-binding protein
MTELLRADHLTRHFKIGGALAGGTLHAVDDVSFAIGEREIVALAGESGSGKSTVARLLARVYKPTSGTVTYFGDRDPGAGNTGNQNTGSQNTGTPLSALRSRRAGLRYSAQVPMVFQDPFSSLNPVFRVSHGVLRALKLHRSELSGAERRAEAARAFDVVGLGAGMLDRYPYELSGGQRQRVGFAQALATRPRLILADEPVSMLDTSIRIGLLNLMAKLRDEEGVSILYITHDIASARYVADRLIVMYAGQIAESGAIDDVLAAPRHPYTQLLLSAVPDPKAPPPSLEALAAASGERGEPPKVIDPKPGCRFQPRCPVAIETCKSVTPELKVLGLGEVACHVAQSGAEVKAFT